MITTNDELKVIFIRKERGIGDIAMALRAMELTRLAYPFCEIAVISRYPELLRSHPAIDKSLDIEDGIPEDVNGSIIVDLRVKHDYAKCKHEMFCQATSDALEQNGYEGIEWDGKGQNLWVTRQMNNWAGEYIEKFRGDRIPIGVYWRSAQEFKNWDGFQSVVRMLSYTDRYILFCFDGTEPLIANKNVINIVGMDLEMVMALTGKMEMVLGVDTGGLHIAGGLGIPIVGIFGPTDPVKLIKTYQNSKWFEVDCRQFPCWFERRCLNRECLTKLKPEVVYNKINDMFPVRQAKRLPKLFWDLPHTEARKGQVKHLIARFIGIGDVGMLMFALEAYREEFKDDHITLLTSPAGAALFNGIHDIVDRVVYRDFKHHARPREDNDIVLPIDEGFDITHDLINRVDFGEMAYRRNRAENFAALLGVTLNPLRPVRMLELIDYERAWFDKIAGDRERVITFQLDSNGLARHWFDDYWEQLATLIYREYGPAVKVMGLATKRHEIKRKPPNYIDLACQTNIRQFITAILLSDILVCADSSGMHIGGRSDKTQVIGLFGSTGIADDGKWAHTEFYKNIHPIVSKMRCSPCWDWQFHSCRERMYSPMCLRKIKPRQVMEKIRGIMNT